MFIKKSTGPRAVRLPNGRIISCADLPPENTKRWVASRKETVILAVTYGVLAREEAISRYNLTEEEFEEWLAAMTAFGNEGLKVTKIQNAKQS